jgi:hypothetical protein
MVALVLLHHLHRLYVLAKGNHSLPNVPRFIHCNYPPFRIKLGSCTTTLLFLSLWTLGYKVTTGLVFFAECLRHSAKTILHSVKSLSSVTLGKEYSANILSAKDSLPSTFFGHSVKSLPSVEKHSTNKNTRQIKNHKKPQKIAKHFFNYVNQLSNHYPITIIIALSFFTINLNQIYMFCEWWDSNSQPPSHVYHPLPVHYYINYVHITFSFIMYYNKPRVIWLFEALNKFI